MVCLNGIKNSALILSLVPDQAVFRKTLKMARFWAKQKGLYGGVLGYLGGVHYAIMVAKVCQMFPSLPAGQMLLKFFRVFSYWDMRMPVMIQEGPLE